MKAFKVLLSLVFAAGLIGQAAGISCDSQCATCWKTGQKGVDTKLGCITRATEPNLPAAVDCGSTCPTGYERMHCAKSQRCHCNHPDPKKCRDFGPCQFGYTADQFTSSCKPDPNLK